ncbi:MAG: 50S ribosomal protein L18e [Candidatus Pacearchaeota archaeon]
MKSKTKIGKQIEKKTSSELVETIVASKKNDSWNAIASVLSGPRKNRMSINLDEISRISKAGETIAVPGKVLSQGELDKKIKLIALAFSESARKKIIDAKGEMETLINEIKKNPSAKGVRILTGKGAETQ